MTAAKIAITLQPEQLAGIHRAVKSGRAASVSAYIAGAIEQQAREESLAALLQDLIAEHGEPTKKDRAWAKRVLGLPKK
jgi:Arc/MetJ-type ribon-helix-helix transcriptional regulator